MLSNSSIRPNAEERRRTFDLGPRQYGRLAGLPGVHTVAHTPPNRRPVRAVIDVRRRNRHELDLYFCLPHARNEISVGIGIRISQMRIDRGLGTLDRRPGVSGLAEQPGRWGSEEKPGRKAGRGVKIYRQSST